MHATLLLALMNQSCIIPAPSSGSWCSSDRQLSTQISQRWALNCKCIIILYILCLLLRDIVAACCLPLQNGLINDYDIGFLPHLIPVCFMHVCVWHGCSRCGTSESAGQRCSGVLLQEGGTRPERTQEKSSCERTRNRGNTHSSTSGHSLPTETARIMTSVHARCCYTCITLIIHQSHAHAVKLPERSI